MSELIGMRSIPFLGNGEMLVKSQENLVFVVDDESALVELMEVLLIPEGFKVKTFTDGESTLEEIRKCNPKPYLLITDGQMGELSGPELIEKSKKIVPTIKTMLVSGSISENEIKHLSVKPDIYLSKPYTALKFTRRVSESMTSRAV